MHFFGNLGPNLGVRKVPAPYRTGDSFDCFSGAFRLTFGGQRRRVEPETNLCRTWDEPVSKLSRSPVERHSNNTRTTLEQHSKRSRSAVEQKVNFLEELWSEKAFFGQFLEQNLSFPEEMRWKRNISFKSIKEAIAGIFSFSLRLCRQEPESYLQRLYLYLKWDAILNFWQAERLNQIYKKPEFYIHFFSCRQLSPEGSELSFVQEFFCKTFDAAGEHVGGFW
jgi:hypothetical protein